jgi:indolepyruvate ferredoxin oxidoreductase
VEIARIPEQIKGFGHVKERHLKAARQNWAELMAAVPCPGKARVSRGASSPDVQKPLS